MRLACPRQCNGRVVSGERKVAVAVKVRQHVKALKGNRGRVELIPSTDCQPAAVHCVYGQAGPGNV